MAMTLLFLLVIPWITNSNTIRYVTHDGCDFGNCESHQLNYTYICLNHQNTLSNDIKQYCCDNNNATIPTSQEITTCKSIEYALMYSSLSSIIVDVGAGEFEIVSIENNINHNININGISNETIITNHVYNLTIPFYQCHTNNCHLSLNDFIFTSLLPFMDNVYTQIHITNENNLSVSNVIFNGHLNHNNLIIEWIFESG
eukprot:117967_1